MSIDLVAASAVIFFAYLIRGVSGFGSALVAVPLLVHFLPLVLVVPLVVILDVVAALALTGAGQRQRHVAWREVAWLLPGSVIGIGFGLWLLVALDRDLLLAGLGLFIVAFGVRQLLGLQGTRVVSCGWALPAGMIGGAVGAVFATGGPPFVIYLAHRLHDKGQLRATLSAVFLIDGTLRLLGMLLVGLLLQPGIGTYLLVGLPLMAAGLYAGHHIHVGLSQRQMAIAVATLLLGSGLSLLLRVLLNPG